MPSSPISDGRTQAASSSRPRTSSLTHRVGAAATPTPLRVRGGAGRAGGIAGGGSSKNGREAMVFTVPWTAHGDLGGSSKSAVRAVTSGPKGGVMRMPWVGRPTSGRDAAESSQSTLRNRKCLPKLPH